MSKESAAIDGLGRWAEGNPAQAARLRERVKKIDLFRPDFDERESAAVDAVLKSGWVGTGPQTALFEKRFAEFTGAGHVVMLNSCSAGLELALRILAIGPEDEVIVPTLTFVAVAHAVRASGATPVFCDVDYATLNAGAADVAAAITAKTRAAIVVHTAGRPCAVDKIGAALGDIPLVEDCAHATGAFFRKRHVGTFGVLGAFSFAAVKNLSTGSGGALATGNAEYAERARRLRWLGISKNTWERHGAAAYEWDYRVEEFGVNAAMNDIAAAIGLVQLEKLRAANLRRRAIGGLYRELLANVAEITLPPEDDAAFESSWHMFVIKARNRDGLAAHLAQNGVTTGVHYRPLHTHPAYRTGARFPVAERLFGEILTLPMHVGLSDADVSFVCREIKRWAHAGAR